MPAACGTPQPHLARQRAQTSTWIHRVPFQCSSALVPVCVNWTVTRPCARCAACSVLPRRRRARHSRTASGIQMRRSATLPARRSLILSFANMQPCASQAGRLAWSVAATATQPNLHAMRTPRARGIQHQTIQAAQPTVLVTRLPRPALLTRCATPHPSQAPVVATKLAAQSTSRKQHAAPTRSASGTRLMTSVSPLAPSSLRKYNAMR